MMCIYPFIFSFVSGFIFLSFFKHKPLGSAGLDKHAGKQHEVSCLGGMGIFLSFFCAWAVFAPVICGEITFPLGWIMFCSSVLLMMGFADDVKEFSLATKIITQLVFAVVFLLYSKHIQMYVFSPFINYFISFFWLLGIINAFNLLDISDGLCGGVSLVAVAAFFSVAVTQGNASLAVFFASLGGSLLVFMLFNLPPAKILMGNSGSHFLGFVFAAVSVEGDYATVSNPYALLVPVVILAFPLIDTIYLIIRRSRRGIVPLRKSDDHIFLCLVASGITSRQALVLVYSVAGIWGLSGVLLARGFNLFAAISAAIALFFTVRLIARANRIS